MGELSVKRISAVVDLPGRKVIAPSTLFQFIANTTVGGKEELITWTSGKLGISQQQVERDYYQFIKNWQEALQKNKLVVWKGIGTWKLDDSNTISFHPEMNPAYEGLPVRAEKVLRENVEHQVRVGEDQRSSIEMTALLGAKKKKISFELWLGGSILVLLLVFWFFYLWQHPLTTSSFGNPRKVFNSVTVNK